MLDQPALDELSFRALSGDLKVGFFKVKNRLKVINVS
jgi:hypothetical protein